MAQPPGTLAITSQILDGNNNSIYEGAVVTSAPSMGYFQLDSDNNYAEISITGPFPTSTPITNSYFTIYLPWPSRTRQGTAVTWQLFYPDGSVWAGVVPEGQVGPFNLDTLIQGYGWGAVQTANSVPVLQGKQGEPGAKGDKGDTGAPGTATGQIRDAGGFQYNIMAYGGVGDGVTANDAAWTAMLAAAANGGTLLFPPGHFLFNQFPLFPFNATTGKGKQFTVRGTQHGVFPSITYPVNPATMGTVLDIRADGMSGPPYAGEYSVVKGGDLTWNSTAGTVTVAPLWAHINAPLGQAAVAVLGATLTLPTAAPDDWWTLFVDAAGNYFAVRERANPNLYWLTSGGTGFTALNSAATAGLASNPLTTKPNTIKLASFVMSGGRLYTWINEHSCFGMLNGRGQQVIGLRDLTIGNFSGVASSNIPIIQSTSSALDIDNIGLYGMAQATDLAAAPNNGIVVGGTGGPFSTMGSDTLSAYSVNGGYAGKIRRVTGQNVRRVVHLRANADGIFVDTIFATGTAGGPGQAAISYEGSRQSGSFGAIIQNVEVEGSHYAYGVQLGEATAGAVVQNVVIQDCDLGIVAVACAAGATGISISSNSLPQWFMGWKGQPLLFDPGTPTEEIVQAATTPYTGATIGAGMLLSNSTADGVNQTTTSSTPTPAASMSVGNWYLIGNGQSVQEMNQLYSVNGNTLVWGYPLRNVYTGVTVTQFPIAVPLVGSTVRYAHAAAVQNNPSISRTIANVRHNSNGWPTGHSISGLITNSTIGVDEHLTQWVPGATAYPLGYLRKDTIIYPGQISARPDGLIEAKRGVTAYPVVGVPNDSLYPSGPPAVGALAVRTDTQQLWVKTAAGVWVVVGATGLHGATHEPGGTDDLYLNFGQSSATLLQAFDRFATNVTLGLVSGRVYITFITPGISLLVSNLVVCTQAAGSGLTLARAGLYTLDGSRNMTLVAQSANVSGSMPGYNVLSIPMNTAGGYPANYQLARGTRYAIALIVVGTTPGYLSGNYLGGGTLSSVAPIPCAYLSSQADLPTSIAVGSQVTGAQYAAWMGLS